MQQTTNILCADTQVGALTLRMRGVRSTRPQGTSHENIRNPLDIIKLNDIETEPFKSTVTLHGDGPYKWLL